MGYAPGEALCLLAPTKHSLVLLFTKVACHKTKVISPTSCATRLSHCWIPRHQAQIKALAFVLPIARNFCPHTQSIFCTSYLHTHITNHSNHPYYIHPPRNQYTLLVTDLLPQRPHALENREHKQPNAKPRLYDRAGWAG